MGFTELIRSLPNVHFKENYDIGQHTGLAVGGKAKYFIAPETVNTVQNAVRIAKEHGVEFKAIGNGTNLLVSDFGFDGLLISSKNLTMKLLDKGDVIALGGVQLSSFIRFSVGNGFTGMEGLFGIPASIGGAVCQNAGAFGYTVSDYITEVVAIQNGVLRRFSKSECGFGYRESAFSSGGSFIVSARFKFPKRKTAAKRQEYYAYRLRRNGVQPSGRSCGSVFKNPKGDYAARLIEGAGMKGFRIGGAFVSDMHANFILTDKGASAKDVYSVISEIKKRVYEKYGVTLDEEVEFLGVFK